MTKHFYEPITITHPLFSCTAQISDSGTLISFFTSSPYVNTRALPGVTSVLEEHCPRVLTSFCENPGNLPFKQEVEATEIGHLFEHLVLQYLYDEKIRIHPDPIYSGRTNWNWHTTPRGTFSIWIDCEINDHSLLARALHKAADTLSLTLTPSHHSRYFSAPVL